MYFFKSSLCRIPIFLNMVSLFVTPPSQPLLLSTHRLPSLLPLDVALFLPFLPPPLSPPKPTMWRPKRPRWDCCLLCWRIRPGVFMLRRHLCSSAWLWVSGASDSGLHTINGLMWNGTKTHQVCFLFRFLFVHSACTRPAMKLTNRLFNVHNWSCYKLPNICLRCHVNIPNAGVQMLSQHPISL